MQVIASSKVQAALSTTLQWITRPIGERTDPTCLLLLLGRLTITKGTDLLGFRYGCGRGRRRSVGLDLLATAADGVSVAGAGAALHLSRPAPPSEVQVQEVMQLQRWGCASVWCALGGRSGRPSNYYPSVFETKASSTEQYISDSGRRV